MKLFLKEMLAVGAIFAFVGCGGGSSSGQTSNTPSNTPSNTQNSNPQRAYYVDEPIENVHFDCGKHQGETDFNGTILFEKGKGCVLSIAGIKLREIPASMLRDGVIIFESDLKVATLIQSLDSEESNDKIVIKPEVIEELKSLKVTQIPEGDELKDIIEKINQKKKLNLKPKTIKEAKEHLKESYKKYKDKKPVLTNPDTLKDEIDSKSTMSPSDVDDSTEKAFGADTTEDKISDTVMKALVGNWAGEANHIRVKLQLRRDGTYKYQSRLGIGKYHNYYRYSNYEGKWHLANGNSQIVLELPNVDAPLILTNRFPKIETPIGVELSAGSDIDTSYQMQIDQSKNIITAKYTDKAKKYMKGKIADFQVPYFTMVAPKANSEEFWKSVETEPKGYNYGHKIGDWTPEWKYALDRIKNDPHNYTMVISDENWQTLIGNRGNYTKDIQKPEKMYKWLEFFKDQMQILGKVEGTVLYIIAGDAPAYWVSSIRSKYNNDASTIPAKLIESRFPEVLERNPSNSFAGVFQMMDYLRMKYAPNVKLGYTIKTWGIVTKDIYHEPQGGWDTHPDTQTMADTINSFGIQFDFLSFNYHPRSSHTVPEYESAGKYFGAISKKLKTRDGSKPKLWIWKLSLWNKEQPKFCFTHIDFLVNECNVIGMTLGHGNDLKKLNGFKDDPKSGIYVKSWMIEYFNNKTLNIPVHAVRGLVNWK